MNLSVKLPISVRSRSIFFDLTDLDRPKPKPTRPRSFFDRDRPFSQYNLEIAGKTYLFEGF